MPGPTGAIHIVQGEISLVVMAMRRGNKWTYHTYQNEDDALLKNFSDLKEILNHIKELSDIEPNQFLSPFLDVVRSEDTTGPVTGLALTSVYKFLTYGLIDSSCETASLAVENITDAVTHARFVGTDPSSDEVVLMKILQVLRTLLLTPVGTLLTNEAVCEIMQSCFRICFEMRLSELLRKSAEHSLVDMVQLLFARLPHFADDNRVGGSYRKLKMRAGTMDTGRNKSTAKKKSSRSGSRIGQKKSQTDLSQSSHLQSAVLSCESPDSGVVTPVDTASIVTSPGEPKELSLEDVTSDKETTPETTDQGSKDTGYVDIQGSLSTVSQHYGSTETLSSGEFNQLEESKPLQQTDSQTSLVTSSGNVEEADSATSTTGSDYINPRGVRFTAQQEPLIPYGLPCVRELLRFLISLINPVDKHNSEVMIHIGLSLLTVAMETATSYLSSLPSLLSMLRDELCRHLFFLINSERLTMFAAALRVCFLLFESLRSHLKFQLEMYLSKLMAILQSESGRVSYELREAVLDSIVQLWRIPGLPTELYLNYDCNLYCSNLFEELTKLLSKNAFPVAGLYSIHLLSLDALLAVIDSIEGNCHQRMISEQQAAAGAVTLVGNTLPVIEEASPTKQSTVNDSSQVFTYTCSGYLSAIQLTQTDGTIAKGETPKADVLLGNKVPSQDDLVRLKQKKKLLLDGTKEFNTQPVKGIAFLQEHGLLSTPLDPIEVVEFLKENPRLDKRMIGEYISNRKNLKVLEAFVKSFTFEDMRIDEALRLYLETFRLPGEAPLISLLMEHFADHWHKTNNEPFANSDAAFTLAYAVIMLNVDQHNNNVKKQSNPMTIDEFKRNVSKVNGGEDFDYEMLEDIYSAIKNDEIVMPAEQTGLVKENYVWKMLLRRGASKDGTFISASNGQFDQDLFTLTWGPTVAALSFVFDKSNDDGIVQRSVAGFRKCAMISAHFGMSEVFDQLVITLCKFTTLLNIAEPIENLPTVFDGNSKAQLATKLVFSLCHRHGDILREGWRNLLDLLHQLFRAKLLPQIMVETEDFIAPNGRISIIREEICSSQRATAVTETGLFSSFYSYITLGSESVPARGLSPEDKRARERAAECISECRPDSLTSDSKFLRADSLMELIKALIFASPGPETHISLSTSYDEDATVFFLNLLVELVLQNRDRVTTLWIPVKDHIYSLMTASNASEHMFVMERSVVCLLRVATRLIWREDMTAEVLQSLQMLLLLRPVSIARVSRQIAFAVHEILKSNAANIHSSRDWAVVYALLEVAGAGAKPSRSVVDLSAFSSTVVPNAGNGINDAASDSGAQSDSDLVCASQETEGSGNAERGYTSDSELYDVHAGRHQKPASMDHTGSWIMISHDGDIEPNQSHSPGSQSPIPPPPSQTTPSHTSIPGFSPSSLILQQQFLHLHDVPAFFKSCEVLRFLVRDAAHITPENFHSCIHCVRVFSEAGLRGAYHLFADRNQHGQGKERGRFTSKLGIRRRDDVQKHPPHRVRQNRANGATRGDHDDREDEEEEKLAAAYHQTSIQLLDLMHTLHTRAASIFSAWASEENGNPGPGTEGMGSLWSSGWCPLLQGIARLCCDFRRPVRTSAVTYLQRALLVYDLQKLTPLEWEGCFRKVLFPLLATLLENINPNDPAGLEETRMRAATLLCKVFLQHLSPLMSLVTFTNIWLTILDFMDKYMHADKSDLLCEAIPESMKNMLLVMDTAGLFPQHGNECGLWMLTWNRITHFLPNLEEEVFKTHQVETKPEVTSAEHGTEVDQTTTPGGTAEIVSEVNYEDKNQHTPAEDIAEQFPTEVGSVAIEMEEPVNAAADVVIADEIIPSSQTSEALAPSSHASLSRGPSLTSAEFMDSPTVYLQPPLPPQPSSSQKLLSGANYPPAAANIPLIVSADMFSSDMPMPTGIPILATASFADRGASPNRHNQ